MTGSRSAAPQGQADRGEQAAVAQDLARGVAPRIAGDAAARMGSGAAHIEALDRRAVAGVAQKRARGPELIQRHVAVHDVPAGQAECALQVQGREDHPAQVPRP